MLAHDQVFRDVCLAGYAGGQPVLRHMGQAQAANFAWGEALDRVSLNLHVTGGNGAHAGNGLQKFALPVALHRGNAQDLVGMQLEGNPPHSRQAPVVPDLQALYGDEGVPRRSLLGEGGMEHLPADHHGGQLPLRHLTGLRQAHQLALTHDAHPVGVAMTS